MRATGVPAGAQRLAVVISKADLLSSAGLELPGGSEEIADWLLDAGPVYAHMEREFADVRFFAVTSRDVSAGLGTDQGDPAAPLRWLLGPLPARAAFRRRSERHRAGPVPGESRRREPAHSGTAAHGDRSGRDSGVSSGTFTPSENPARPPWGPALPGRHETAGGGDSEAGNSSGGAGSRGGSGPAVLGDPSRPPVRHLTGDLPERAPAGRRISLIVRITLAAPDRESVPLERLSVLAEGCDVTVTVSAPALVALGDLEQDVHVPAAADSEPIRFSFMTGRAGLHRVLVRAFAGGTFLGELALQISVEVGAALEEGPSRATALAGLAAEPGEVTLQVSRTGKDRYSFQLIAEALYPVELTRRLAGDPTEVIGALVEELRAIAAHHPRTHHQRWSETGSGASARSCGQTWCPRRSGGNSGHRPGASSCSPSPATWTQCRGNSYIR